MDASATSPVEIDFAYIMKRYERAYVRIFAMKLAAEIEEAEAFGARARTLDMLYANLQFSDFAQGYAALAEISNEPELKAYRRSCDNAFSVGFATARLKEIDDELPEFGALPFALAIERRLGRKAAQLTGNDFDRALWRLYRIFSEPWRIEVTLLQSRQLIFLLGLIELLKALPAAERQRWGNAGWPKLTSETISQLLKGSRPDVFVQSAWEQL